MARLYLDENVAVRAIPLLAMHGHEAIWSRLVMPSGTSDHHHVTTAKMADRIIVTHDGKHFLLLHRAWHEWFAMFGNPPLASHAGIIFIPQPPTVSIERAVDLIADLLGRPGTRTLANRFLSWTSRSGWIEEQ